VIGHEHPRNADVDREENKGMMSAAIPDELIDKDTKHDDSDLHDRQKPSRHQLRKRQAHLRSFHCVLCMLLDNSNSLLGTAVHLGLTLTGRAASATPDVRQTSDGARK
jgi:hypothetical protein